MWGRSASLTAGRRVRTARMSPVRSGRSPAIATVVAGSPSRKRQPRRERSRGVSRTVPCRAWRAANSRAPASQAPATTTSAGSGLTLRWLGQIRPLVGPDERPSRRLALLDGSGVEGPADLDGARVDARAASHDGHALARRLLYLLRDLLPDLLLLGDILGDLLVLLLVFLFFLFLILRLLPDVG